MNDIILISTAVFLFLTLGFVEIYARTRGRVGTLISIAEPDSMLGWVSCKGTARLADGSEVELEMPGCTICLEKLRLGDRVRFIQSPVGYRLVGKVRPKGETAKTACPIHKLGEPSC